MMMTSEIVTAGDGRDTPSSSESDPELAPMEGLKAVKEQQMYLWNDNFEKWHECTLTFKPPYLLVTEHEDTRIEMQDKQLQHHKERWFHGGVSRREAKFILQDYAGGDGSFLVRTSESYNGKFAISFMHEERVKHIVIETRPDPVTGVLYYITPQGPCFDSLTDLIEEAQHTCIIQNHLFDVILTKSPPKIDSRWLHKNVKTLSQAEKLMRKTSREGSFFVYKTSSDYAPYSLVYRHGGSIIHTPILSGQRSSHAYSLHGISTPVLYKLIHYYMENPIRDHGVLEHPIEDKNNDLSNSAIACSDSTGDPLKNELRFTKGVLITNVSRKSSEWCVGDHRGDRQKFFPTRAVRFLTKMELQYIKEVKAALRGKVNNLIEDDEDEDGDELPADNSEDTQCLNLQSDYSLTFANNGSLDIMITPTNLVLASFGHPIRLSCTSCHDMEQWYQTLERNHCLPRRCSETTATVASGNKRKGRKKRGSCIIS